MAEQSFSDILRQCTERCQKMNAPLADRLKSFADDVRAINAEFADVVERMVVRLREARLGENAPKPGEPMPEFMLPDQNGRLYILTELLSTGPAVIAFHRGHWCPYCRINARALASITDDVRGLGGQLVAITPEFERFNAELASGSKADFPVLSDVDNSYALMLNLAYLVNEEKKNAMISAGWDFSPYQGNSNWTLPIPATFVVRQDGIVSARFIDPDYRHRMDPDAILGALKLLRRS